MNTTKTKHTPGPWHYDGESGIVTAGSNPGCPYIADCRVGFGVREVGSTSANARLIASAPAMLEALKGAVERIDTLALHVESKLQKDCALATINQARAAIAQAQGGGE